MTECYTSTPQGQAKDTNGAGCVTTGDGFVLHDSGQQEDAADNPNDHDDPGSTNTRVSSLIDGKVDDKVTPVEPQSQEVAGADEGLSALGNDTSCGTFASTTGSGDDSQEQGKGGGLLTGGLAVAVSGHWRAAELQFEDTAQRVSSE